VDAGGEVVVGSGARPQHRVVVRAGRARAGARRVAGMGAARRALVSGLAVDTPAALALLTLVPLVWLVARRRPGSGAATGLRMTAVVALVLALAGLHHTRNRPAGGACVLVAADASDSMAHASARAAGAALAPVLASLGPRDVVGALRFAATSEVVRRPVSGGVDVETLLAAGTDLFDGRSTGPDGDPRRPHLDTTESDLGGVLATAATLCPPQTQPALLLVTDGHETRGSVLAEAALASTPLPVFPVVAARATLPLAELRRLLAPALVAAGTRWPLEAVVESRATTPLDVEIVLAADAEEPLVHAARIPPGTSVVGLPHPIHGPGPLLLEARLRLPPDLPQPTGVAQASLTVASPLAVLVVSQRAPSVIAAALAEQHVDADVVTPAALRPARLAAAHVVLLDDVGSRALAPGVLDALEGFVARGGGLVVTGGPHLFGDAGYLQTPLARLLPTELLSQEPEPEEREPIALELVIDRSNSMGYVSRQGGVAGEKMEYARRAALAVLEQLAPEDVIGAIAFDAVPHELSPPLPAREVGATLTSRIGTLNYGGGTDFKDALLLAHDRLAAVDRRVRHVILLTDGDTNRRVDDHYQVIDELARAGVTVTAIRIGADTVNLELLAIIAEATGGEFHHVPRVEALPQLMIHDARIVMEHAARRSRLPVRVRDGGPILAGLEARELPEVTRWARTRPRPGAEVRLEIESRNGPEPLLVTWQYELGRVAVLPVDFQAGAARWPGWSGFGTLWTQLAQWAAAPGLADDVSLRARRTGPDVELTVETVEGDPSPVTVTFADGRVLRLRPSGGRTFTATASGLAAGLHHVTLQAGRLRRDLELMAPAHAASPREHRPGPPNLGLLRTLAETTGGAMDASPARILAARPGTERERVPLDGGLALAAMIAVLADVGLRRRTSQ